MTQLLTEQQLLGTEVPDGPVEFSGAFEFQSFGGFAHAGF
jgi:hypothetical protein